MTHFASIVRFTVTSTVALVLASACGGAFSNAGGDGGNAGTATGGSHNQAGTKNTAGKPAAGENSGATGSGGTNAAAGTSSSGGSNPGGEACNAPAESGMCEAAFPRWFHDVTTGLCRPFTYGGCGGNLNNYETFEDCQKACPGGTPNYDACKLPSDCAIGYPGCCGVCDGPNITERELMAHNKMYGEQVSTCGAGDVSCSPCLAPAPGQGTLKYFVPNCVQGQCAVEDVRLSTVTACKTQDDCRLRYGTGCCEGCGGSELVAVRNDGSFEKLVCGGLQPPCAACEPIPPQGAVAECSLGHCQVAYLLDAN